MITEVNEIFYFELSADDCTGVPSQPGKPHLSPYFTKPELQLPHLTSRGSEQRPTALPLGHLQAPNLLQLYPSSLNPVLQLLHFYSLGLSQYGPNETPPSHLQTTLVLYLGLLDFD